MNHEPDVDVFLLIRLSPTLMINYSLTYLFGVQLYLVSEFLTSAHSLTDSEDKERGTEKKPTGAFTLLPSFLKSLDFGTWRVFLFLGLKVKCAQKSFLQVNF